LLHFYVISKLFLCVVTFWRCSPGVVHGGQNPHCIAAHNNNCGCGFGRPKHPRMAAFPKGSSVTRYFTTPSHLPSHRWVYEGSPTQGSLLFLSDPICVEPFLSLSPSLWFCIMREMLSKLPQFRGCQYNQSVIA
jgi:hypothetical protein